MLDLFELQKDITLGKKIIVAPKEAEDSDLPVIVDCIKGGQDITLDLSETKITKLGEVFSRCNALKSIILPKGLVSIGDNAFEGCSALAQVVIPESVTSIGFGAFIFCMSLEQVTIPESVTSIGDHAFFGCRALAKIDVASGNKNYSSVDGVLFSEDKKTLVFFPLGKAAKSYEIPKGVTAIGAWAFCWCMNLEQVVIPESVTSIGDYAFRECKSLAQVVISESVTNIKEGASVGCEALAQVTIPRSVTSIGDYAFVGCSGLMQVTIPSGVTSIGGSAFSGCRSLAQVVIPESVTSIGDAAFYACESLTQIAIPASVTSIGVRVFSLCETLAKIDIASGNKHYSSVDGVLFSKDKKTLVRFPPGKPADYYEIPRGVTTIGDSAFLVCSALAQVVIPSSVTSIEDFAFWGCTKLADKDGFVIVNGILFDYTRNVSSVVIPVGVTKVYGSAFYSCRALAKIDIASGNKHYSSVDGVLFSKDKKTLVCFPQGKAADYYEIPEGVSAIGAWAFAGCSALVQVVIPESVTSIGETALSSLPQVTFADTSGWYFDKVLTQCAQAGDLASSLKDGKALYKKTR